LARRKPDLDTAVVRGRWRLVFAKPEGWFGRLSTMRGGLFTLIFKKFAEGWKIVHDHSAEFTVLGMKLPIGRIYGSGNTTPDLSSLIAADTFRPYLERDSSNGDMPNVTSFSGIYELPAGRGHRFASTGVGDALLGGWSLNAILSLQSGMPVTVTQATNNNSFAGFALQRPNIVGNPSLPPGQRTPARYFNTAAFATAPQFVIGTASRNPVRGPAYRDLDVALVKNLALPLETSLQFRAEMFDVTNTPAFSQPNGSFGSAAFGSITSTTTDPRVMQFALRLSR